MATIVVLIEGERAAAAIDPAAVSELGRLGVTSVAVLHDDAGIGVVLEGWAFDPARAGERAAAVVAGRRECSRMLHPLLHAAISTQQPVPIGVAAPAGGRSRENANRQEAR